MEGKKEMSENEKEANRKGGEENESLRDWTRAKSVCKRNRGSSERG